MITRHLRTSWVSTCLKKSKRKTKTGGQYLKLLAIKIGFLEKFSIRAHVVVHGYSGSRVPTTKKKKSYYPDNWDSAVLGRYSPGTIQSWDGLGTVQSWDSSLGTAVLGRYGLGTVQSWDSILGTVQSWDGAVLGRWPWDSGLGTVRS